MAWARRFARINALALRKIAKKHDKLMHSRAGHIFLQARNSHFARAAEPLPGQNFHSSILSVALALAWNAEVLHLSIAFLWQRQRLSCFLLMSCVAVHI